MVRNPARRSGTWFKLRPSGEGWPRQWRDKTGEAVTKFLEQNLEGRFGGAMIRQSKTWSGMLSNMWDYWDSFQRRIGAGGFFDVVENRLAGFFEYLETLYGDGTLDRWSANLSWGFTKAADGVAYLAGQIVREGAVALRPWPVWHTLRGLIYARLKATDGDPRGGMMGKPMQTAHHVFKLPMAAVSCSETSLQPCRGQSILGSDPSPAQD